MKQIKCESVVWQLISDYTKQRYGIHIRAAVGIKGMCVFGLCHWGLIYFAQEIFVSLCYKWLCHQRFVLANLPENCAGENVVHFFASSSIRFILHLQNDLECCRFVQITINSSPRQCECGIEQAIGFYYKLWKIEVDVCTCAYVDYVDWINQNRK